MSVEAAPGNTYFLQEESATRYMREQEKRMPELAKKHNVTVTQPIHCEYLIEGDAKDIANFLEELSKVTPPGEPLPTEFDFSAEWPKKK